MTCMNYEENKELSRCEKYWIVPYYWRMVNQWEIIIFHNSKGHRGLTSAVFGYAPGVTNAKPIEQAKNF